jgi:hypothetical protein
MYFVRHSCLPQTPVVVTSFVKRRIDRHGPPYLIGREVKAKSLVGGD